MSDNKTQKDLDPLEPYYDLIKAVSTGYVILIILNAVLNIFIKSAIINYPLSIIILMLFLYEKIHSQYPNLTYDTIKKVNFNDSFQLPTFYKHYAAVRSSYRPFIFYSFLIVLAFSGLLALLLLNDPKILFIFITIIVLLIASVLQILVMIHLSLKIKLNKLGISFDELEALAQKNSPSVEFNETVENSPQDIPSTHDVQTQDKNQHQERPVWQAKPTISAAKMNAIPQEAIYVRQLQAYQTAVETQLFKRHLRLLQHLLEVFKELYTAQSQQNLSHLQHDQLNQLQQNCFHQVQQNVSLYLKYSADARMRYDRTLDTVPDSWLSKQLHDAIEQLIQDIAFLYENNLQAFLDHQTFLEQKFQDTETEFQIVHPAKNTPNR